MGMLLERSTESEASALYPYMECENGNCLQK